MNLSAKSKNLPVQMTTLKQILIRMMTRNEKDPTQRMLDRNTMLKNFETLGATPENHLVFVMQLMEKLATDPKGPPFELGIMMGVTLTLCARNVAGCLLLKQIIEDIDKQQARHDFGEPETSDTKSADVTQPLVSPPPTEGLEP